MIISSATSNQEFNTDQINRVRSDLIQGIDSIVSQMSGEIKDYVKSKNDFIDGRTTSSEIIGSEIWYST